MNAISFDTLRYVKRLQAGGFSPEQAEAQAEALALAIGDSLATSEELQHVAASLESKIDKAEASLSKDINDLRLEIRAEIREANLGLVKWIVPMLIGQTAIVAALVKLF